ncbi:hypothetical protein [Rathayibacter sp. VKM Ac-2760]|uniref:hypothetical protein n=1 Tax=Rathayibacter sp. VKM Ac-2760 TaxID=2609253 RepID=UPI001318D2D5|nr:hypothetical protein [Rathayibacter sp. VKM Ac-2760]QHC58641.1 hypothetical protein GSU72_08825 [Rathayibacter sp. VKM Ac-2760]
MTPTVLIAQLECSERQLAKFYNRRADRDGDAKRGAYDDHVNRLYSRSTPHLTTTKETDR